MLLTQCGWAGSTETPCNSNVWVPVGKFFFEPGDGQYVELRVDKDAKSADNVHNPLAFADAGSEHHAVGIPAQHVAGEATVAGSAGE